MARVFVSGSSQYLQVSSAVLTSAPLTMACWGYSTTLTATGVLMSINDSAGSHRFQISAEGAAAGDPISAFAQAAGNGNAQTTSSYPANTWFHAAGVFASSTSRASYLNGGNKGTNTTSVAPSGVNTTALGTRYASGSRGLFLSGRVAHAAIWDDALTDDEILVLSTGMSPLLVRPVNLVAYWPLDGNTSPEIDIVGRYELTVTGATKGDSPRVFLPSAQILQFPTASGGGSIESGAGSSAGSATASGVGASTAAAAGTSAGSATAPGVGASTAAATGTAAGQGAATGAGASTAAATGTSSGTSTATGVSPGGSTESGAGTSAGSATAAGVGASTAAATGTSAGSATATAVGSDGAAATPIEAEITLTTRTAVCALSQRTMTTTLAQRSMTITLEAA